MGQIRTERGSLTQGSGSALVCRASGACSEDADQEIGVPRGHPANPGLGDALVPERGARRATGNQAYTSQRTARYRKMPSWGSALPGGTPPIPDLEMRSSPSAEPAGRRGTGHTPANEQHATERCRAGARRFQGAPRQSQTWRCARPRARSPQGDGEPGIHQPTNSMPPEDAELGLGVPRGTAFERLRFAERNIPCEDF
jgi:hypothetical protein